MWQWDYLHLEGLRDALERTIREGGRDLPSGPVLDLFCGTKPYRALLDRPWWGLDIDDHFGRADVIGYLPLPLADESFALVLVTQALHLVEDPQGAVDEIRRVTMAGGRIVVTVPRIFRRDLPYERRLTDRELTGLFAGWQDIHVEPIGGPGAGAAYIVGKLAAGAARRFPVLRPLLPLVAVVLNATASVVDLVLGRIASRPASVLLVATKPDDRRHPTEQS